MATARVPRKAHLGFIFATIFIYCLGIGLLIPILPDVIRRFSSDPIFVGQYFGYFIFQYLQFEMQVLRSILFFKVD